MFNFNAVNESTIAPNDQQGWQYKSEKEMRKFLTNNGYFTDINGYKISNKQTDYMLRTYVNDILVTMEISWRYDNDFDPERYNAWWVNEIDGFATSIKSDDDYFDKLLDTVKMMNPDYSHFEAAMEACQCLEEFHDMLEKILDKAKNLRHI